MKKLCLILLIISKFCFAEVNGYFGVGLGVSGSSDGIGPAIGFNAGVELDLNFAKLSIEGFAEQSFWIESEEKEKSKPNPNLIVPHQKPEEETIYPFFYGIKSKLFLNLVFFDFYFLGGFGEEKSRIFSTRFAMFGAGIQINNERHSVYFETNYIIDNNDTARLNIFIGTKIYFKS